jgi:hypothetical protein
VLLLELRTFDVGELVCVMPSTEDFDDTLHEEILLWSVVVDERRVRLRLAYSFVYLYTFPPIFGCPKSEVTITLVFKNASYLKLPQIS